MQLLTPEGERVHHPEFDHDFSAEELRGFYRDMVLTRRIDTEATALQRQGELGIWAQLLGQEAAQIGAGRALRPQDFVFPTYREHGVAYCRGVDPLDLLGLFRGVDQGGWDPHENNFGLYTIVIGAQALHATGYAMGIQRDGVVGTGDPERDAAVIAHFGDGASTQGDVNEAFIFAASYNAPVVFFCQNNQWAISEPIERQTRIPLYQRALGFGFPGVRVDGNDVLATYAVTQAALQRARDGQGPTLVEAYTYRMGAHTTTDDPTRYRLNDDDRALEAQGPDRAAGGLPAPQRPGRRRVLRRLDAEAEELGHHLREGCKALPDPKPLDMFDHVYTEMTEELAAQRDGFAAYLASFEGAHDERNQKITLAKGLNMGLRKAMEDDPKVLLMGEDIGKLGGVFRVTDGLQKDFGEDRVIDSPLAESGIVGTAIGLALRGYRPVVEIQFDGFVYPAFDQIVCQVAKMRVPLAGQVKMPIVIRIPFGGGIGAVEHHSECPEAHFAHTPGLKVVACSNPVDAYWMIQQAIACDDPVIFLEPKRRYRPTRPSSTSRATPEPLFTVARRAPGHRRHRAGLRPDGEDRAGGGRGRRRRGPQPRGHRPAHAVAARHRPGLESVRSTGRCVVTHEAPSTSAWARRSPRGSPRSASTPSRLRCCASAASTCPTRRPGSRRSTSPTSTASSTPSTAPSPTERTDRV